MEVAQDDLMLAWVKFEIFERTLDSAQESATFTQLVADAKEAYEATLFLMEALSGPPANWTTFPDSPRVDTLRQQLQALKTQKMELIFLQGFAQAPVYGLPGSTVISEMYTVYTALQQAAGTSDQGTLLAALTTADKAVATLLEGFRSCVPNS
jgi:hypothetical protein